MLHTNIANYLDNLNPVEKDDNFTYYSISKCISNILFELKNYEPTIEDNSELIAFEFTEGYKDIESGWGTYYGPIMTGPNGRGQFVEYPSIQKLSPEILSYWLKRAYECKNPILKSRYADLVIDFSKKINNRYPKDFKHLVEILIDASLEICDKLLLEPVDCIIQIKRIFDLASSFNLVNEKTKIVEQIIRLEKEIGNDDKPGQWGFAFDWLILEKKDILVNEEVRNNLIKDMEARLERVKKATLSAEKAAGLLAEWYSEQKDEENLVRVLKILEESYKYSFESEGNPFQINHAYGKIREIYELYMSRGFSSLKQQLQRIMGEINNLNLNWDEHLTKIEVPFEIPTDVIHNFKNEIFDLEAFPESKHINIVISRIVYNLKPKKEDLEERFKNSIKENSLYFLVTHNILSDDGVLLGNISGIEDTKEKNKHLISYSKNLFSMNFILNIILKEFKDKYSEEKIFDYLSQADIFLSENKNYLIRAIKAYYQEDYIVSSHLFIPIIETAIREIVKMCGGEYIEYKYENNGYHKKSLSQLLEKYALSLNRLFEDIDSEISFFLKVVLTETFGFNYRNDFAHGLEKKKFESEFTSNLLFLIIILFSLIKKK